MYNDLDYDSLGVLAIDGKEIPIDFSKTLNDVECEDGSNYDGENLMNLDSEYSFDMMPSKETLREMDKFFHRYGYLFSDIRDKSNNWKKMHGYKMTRRSGRKFKNRSCFCSVDLSDFRINKVVIDGEEFDYAEVFANAEE